MEFFVIFGAIFSLCDPRLKEAYGFNTLPVYAAYIIAAIAFAALYVLKAIGLYTMAKKRGKQKVLWCAFVPFAGTWLLGELAGPLRLGRSKFSYFGLLTMISEILLSVCYAMQYIPQAYGYMENMIFPSISSEGVITFGYAEEFVKFVPIMNIGYIAGYIFGLINLVFAVFLYMSFFRAYAPQSYIWLVVVCVVFPVIGICVFAFRNRKFVDYEAYMQARMEQYRRQQQYRPPYGQNPYGQNPYGQNPYGQNPYGQNPYGQNPYGQGGAANKPEDPFGEFSNGGSSDAGDPFGEFAKGKEDDRQEKPQDPKDGDAS